MIILIINSHEQLLNTLGMYSPIEKIKFENFHLNHYLFIIKKKERVLVRQLSCPYVRQTYSIFSELNIDNKLKFGTTITLLVHIYYKS